MRGSEFDIIKCIRFVPLFSEQDVDGYFPLFEHVANMLKWPKNIWPLLLQSVFIGKAQEAYTSLPTELSLNYDEVKSALLRAYELVPEAYHQMFHRSKKTDNLTYQEFGHSKEVMFDCWCLSTHVVDFVGSALQACYCGPYVVREKVSDWDYIIATPERRQKSRLCQINMWKPYLNRESVPQSPVSTEGKVVAALSSAEMIDIAQETLALSSADLLEALAASAVSDVEDSNGRASAVVQGRMKNFEMSKLDECLLHLTQHEEVVRLIMSHVSLFSDVLTRTNVLQHDTDVGESPPIKQHRYRANPNKHLRLQQQVPYMLESGIVEL